jgi:PPOX class probable F420-dependent enzyme
MMTLSDGVRRLFDGKNFAVLSTLEPDGRPHSTVVWTKRDGDDIVFALPKNRRKTANLIRDPRASVVVFDAANPVRAPKCRAPRTLTTTWMASSSRNCPTSTRAGRIQGSPGPTRNG